MRTDLVEVAQEIFLGVNGVSNVDIRTEEIVCVDLVMYDDSEETRHAVYDAELVLRQKFPDTFIRIRLV